MADARVYGVPFDQVSKFTQIDIDYATDPASFSEFINLVPNLTNFGKALTNRSVYPTDRETLVQVLREQYAEVEQDATHCAQLLDPTHFTVVTAHQPALLTGPLYFIYKICSTINLARQITEAHSAYYVHPVFVVGSEDHDFEELNHLNLFTKHYRWENGQTGAVGHMKVDSALLQLLKEIGSVFGQAPYAEELEGLLRECFVDGAPFGVAMQKFIIELFKGTGLIVLRMDDSRLKRRFAGVMRDELFHQTTRQFIEKSQEGLIARGYKPQTYQREINLFYLADGLRGRIVLEDDTFKVVDSDIAFSLDAMTNELQQHPEHFSPNVNLRPLYQEMVLPNLAYIGGGGELAYWLERKLLFDHYKVPLPILVRRNSVLYLDASSVKQKEKLDLPVNILFHPLDAWIADWIRSHAEHEIEIAEEETAIDKALDSIVHKAHQIDPTLGKKYEADKLRILKDVDHLGKRLIRTEKAQNETRIAQLGKLYERLFPGGSLQERHDNFIPQYLRHGRAYLEMLIRYLDPLFGEVLVMEEESSR